MQFNSFFFIFVFLPITVTGYHLINRIANKDYARKLFLILAGVTFYAWAGLQCILFLSGSICMNLLLAIAIHTAKNNKKAIFACSIALNIILLLYLKYSAFFVSTVTELIGIEILFHSPILPLGISFLTFQQIMYIVSVYKGKIEVSVTEYLVYILYFPKMVMGPLVEPKALLDQISDEKTKQFRWGRIAIGLKCFSYGLFKKTFIADSFSKPVLFAFQHLHSCSSLDLFLVMLFYTFQIYFDFSGYCDMATGISEMLNITLPMNFNSPYKAVSNRDFWKRWHISLTQFFTNYLYIPIGGNRRGKWRTYCNTFIVFIVSGMWHGANWTFILWGAAHGMLSIADRALDKWERRLPKALRWSITFLSVNILWLLFRSESVTQWLDIMKQMISLENLGMSKTLYYSILIPETEALIDLLHLSIFDPLIKSHMLLTILLCVCVFLICLFPKNNYETKEKIDFKNLFAVVIAFVFGVLSIGAETEFIYNGF